MKRIQKSNKPKSPMSESNISAGEVEELNKAIDEGSDEEGFVR